MKRSTALLAAAAAVVLSVPGIGEARVREVSIGNYWFEEDGTNSRSEIVVDEGDQLRFTVRENATPPHSAVVDGQFDSGPILLFERYTTPPLRRPGTYLLYCRDHRPRGHDTSLIVRARSGDSTTPTPASPSAPPKPKSSQSATPGRQATTSPAANSQPTNAATPSSTSAPAAAESIAPVGVDRATDRRRPPADPDSLAGLLGRRFGGDQPWTAAVWLSLLALLPIGAITAAALRADHRRRRGPEPMAADRP